MIVHIVALRLKLNKLYSHLFIKIKIVKIEVDYAMLLNPRDVLSAWFP